MGVGCSGGRVVAQARVVESLAEAQSVLPGEILVSPYTDPGWTALFGRLAGVVTECGGMLAHAAVIARAGRRISAFISCRRLSTARAGWNGIA